MRDRIEVVGDILLAAAHADHHVEAQEIDRIEEILKKIWGAGAPAEALARKVVQPRPGESLGDDEARTIGDRLKALEPPGELPAHLVQRLADFDPSTFDIDEAVGPFLHEPVEVKRKLLELAVSVHEADGELDFAEDTFVRELGFKLGLDLSQFRDLLLEVLTPEKGLEPDDAPETEATDALAATARTDLVVPPSSSARKGRAGKAPAKKAPAAKGTADASLDDGAPATPARKAPADKAPAAKKPAAKAKEAPAKKPAAKAKKAPAEKLAARPAKKTPAKSTKKAAARRPAARPAKKAPAKKKKPGRGA